MSGQAPIPIASPYLGEEEWLALKSPLDSGWLTQGPKVAEFERLFAQRTDADHAIATTSCTTALHLILAALELEPDDEVIVPSFTWIASANVVLHAGGVPVLADVDPHTYNLDPEDVARRVTSKTKAVVAVHLFGLCADMEALARAAPNAAIIEDAACAVGASYRGRPAGSLGLAGAFSFHPRKIITTGEGGMVTTSDPALAERMQRLRNHGASVSEEQRHRGPRPYDLPDFDLCGFNYRMTDLQGAVGVVQLGRLDTLLAERREAAAFYARELADLEWLTPPQVPAGCEHSFQAYVCRVDEERAPAPRDVVMERLQAAGVSTRPGTHAVHLLGYYAKRFGLRPRDLPVSDMLHRTTMAIPLHNRMTPADYERVVTTLRGLD